MKKTDKPITSAIASDESASKIKKSQQDGPTLSANLKLYGVSYKEFDLILKRVFEPLTLLSNDLLSLLLKFRGKDYLLDEDNHDGRKELKQYYKSLPAKVRKMYAFQPFSELMVEFYEEFIKSRRGRSFSSFLYSSNTLKETSKLSQKFFFLRKAGVFPIGLPPEVEYSAMFYNVVAEVHQKLCQFESTLENYLEARAEWEAALVGAKLSEIKLYEAFLFSFKDKNDMEKLNARGYTRFIRSWNGKLNKKDEVEIESMHQYFVELQKTNPDKVFEEKDRYRFGYGPDVLNLIYHDYRNLWDVIGDSSYVDIIKGSFNWLKKEIHISSFNRPISIIFGHNFSGYGLDVSNEHLTFDLNMNMTKDKVSVVKSGGNLLLRGRSKRLRDAKIVAADVDNCAYRLYHKKSDNPEAPTFEGNIKEPSLRCKPETRELWMDIPLSNSTSSNSIEKMWELRAHFSSAYAPSKRQKKHKIEDGPYRIAAYDVGMANPFVCVIFEIEMKNNQVVDIDRVATEKCYYNDDSNLQRIKDLKDKIIVTKKLISYSVRLCYGEITTIPLLFGKRGQYNWIEILGLRKNDRQTDQEICDEYIESVKKLPVVDEDIVKHWRTKLVETPLKDIMHSISIEISKLRNKCKLKGQERSDYIKANSTVDMGLFLMAETIKEFVSLQKKFSYKEEDCCKNYWKYYNGLRRKIGSSLASAMVNCAIKHKACLMVMEELDVTMSSGDLSGENRMKAIWAMGQTKVWLKNKANLEGILIAEVDAFLTSQIDPETQKMGYRKGRYIYVNRNNKYVKIDSDEAAAVNVFMKFISHGTTIARLNFRQLEGDTYVASVSDYVTIKGKADGKTENIPQKRRQGIFLACFGDKKSIKLKMAENGEFIVAKSSPTKKQLEGLNALPVKEVKKVEVFRNGDKIVGYAALKDGIKKEFEELVKEDEQKAIIPVAKVLNKNKVRILGKQE